MGKMEKITCCVFMKKNFESYRNLKTEILKDTELLTSKIEETEINGINFKSERFNQENIVKI